MNQEERDRVQAEMRSGHRGSIFGSCLQVVGIIVVATLMLVGITNLIAPGWFPPVRRATPTPLAPTATPVVPIVVQRVQALSRLETMQYTVEWVIDQRRDVEGILPGSERLLLIVHGQVTAGLDFGKIGAADITVSGTSAIVNLPPAEIFTVAINNERSYVYDYRKDWWVKGQPVELVGDALVRAEREIGRAARDDGILDKATANGQSYLRELLATLGFNEIRLITPTATPTLTPTVNLTPIVPAAPAIDAPAEPVSGPVSVVQTPVATSVPTPRPAATSIATVQLPGTS